MAAHNEQTSNTRRKLLKALSSTPLVLTLRPDAAAASSAYQCITAAAEAAPPAPWHDAAWLSTNAPYCTTSDVCFGYRQFWYWAIPSDIGGGTNCTGWAGVTVVEVPQSGGSSRYFTLDGGEITDPRFIVDSSTHQLTINKNTTGAGTCVANYPGQQGLFLVQGEVLVDGQSGPIDWIETGTYPQTQGVGLQGITGTCMASVSNGVPVDWTLSRG